MKSNVIRVRFAPSPTGALHIGGARTALFNFLFSEKNKGIFVLRIEDTDIERSKPEFEKDIIESLKWLGIKYQKGPYKQSERLAVYKKYLEKLLSQDKAYFCFCSKQDLQAQKQDQLSRGEAPKYSGVCAKLDKKISKKYLDENKSCVIRFRTPSKKLVFNDAVRNKVEFDTGLLGDMVIAKNLDAALYNFTVVIDDFEMKINYVIRGEDHLPNTPKQILIQQALGFPEPKYCHLPLILGPDKSKLSKRHAAVAVSDYIKQGYLPEAMINFMALLGWNSGADKEIFSINELIKEFSLEKIQKPGAIFNIQKLDWINGAYIRAMPIAKLTKLCIPYLKEYKQVSSKDLEKIIAIYQERLKKLSEITELTDFFFKHELSYEKELLRWKQASDDNIKLALDKLENILSDIEEKKFTKENLEKILLAEAEKFGKEIKGNRGHLLWPLRTALSGKKASAAPFEIAEILGREKSLKRIIQAKKLL